MAEEGFVEKNAPTELAAKASENAPGPPKHSGKQCFVIMPFGTKTHPFTKEEIDFNDIYETLIQSPLSRILDSENINRSDSATAAGLIHAEMIDDIISADVAIVDITTANPNVMYELGVRHAAKRSGTVVIMRQGDGQAIPFNIGGVRAFEYPANKDPKEMAAFTELLKAAVDNALAGGHVDSLVHGLHRGLNVTRRARPIQRRDTHVYRWPGERESEDAREICIVTGDIIDVMDVDVWVNPENTAMQMGRFYDDSVSASIRYYGAVRDGSGFVKRDTITLELARAMKRRPIAQPGTVVLTGSGCLKSTNGVRKIMHVAAQYGEPSKGYQTVRNAPGCVSNCLRSLDAFHNRPAARLRDKHDFDSILIPLFGVKSQHRIPEELARDLFEAAVLFFEKNPMSLIDRVYFLAYTDVDLALCEQALKWCGLERYCIEPERRRSNRRGRRQAIDLRRRWAVKSNEPSS